MPRAKAIVPRIVRVDGRVEEVKPENGTHFRLQELYRHLGCSMVEVVDLGDGINIMIADEEELCCDEPKLNLLASIAARQQIVGDVLVCPSKMFR